MQGPTGDRPAAHVGSGRWLLLGTALLQAAAPPLIGFPAGAADPPIVPPAPFFAVWGLVLLGCVSTACWGLPARRAGTRPWRRIHVPLSLVQVGFAGWLLAASSAAVWLTLPIFVSMLIGLLACLHRIAAATEAPAGSDRVARVLLGWTLGVYAGWSTAAVWINAATLLPAGAFTGGLGTVVQCAFTAAAGISAAAVSYRLRGPVPYTSSAGWALTGVAASATAAGLPPLTATAATGLLAVTAAAALGRRRTPPTPAT